MYLTYLIHWQQERRAGEEEGVGTGVALTGTQGIGRVGQASERRALRCSKRHILPLHEQNGKSWLDTGHRHDS